jgi:hypothetical protein
VSVRSTEGGDAALGGRGGLRLGIAPVAGWPVEEARVNLANPSTPRYLHVDGEVALLHRPSLSKERVTSGRPSKDAGLRVS